MDLEGGRVDLEGGRDGWSSSSPRMVIPAVLWFRMNGDERDQGPGVEEVALGCCWPALLNLVLRPPWLALATFTQVDIMQNDVVLTSCIL